MPHIHHQVYREIRNNYCHKRRILDQHSLVDNNTLHHCYLILKHTQWRKNDQKLQCQDIYKVDIQFHFQVRDHHNNSQYSDHNCNQLCNLDNLNTLQFVNHMLVHDHYNYMADNRGNSNILFDTDYTPVHKYLVDNYIDQLLNHTRYL